MTERELVLKALEMRKYSYSPYSNFRVGAALECADGTVYGGCNIENVAYGTTICAERTAIFKAVSEGRREFVRIAIVGDSTDLCWPCGSCRQVMREFAPDREILVASRDGTYEAHTLSELLPHSFGPATLNQ